MRERYKDYVEIINKIMRGKEVVLPAAEKEDGFFDGLAVFAKKHSLVPMLYDALKDAAFSDAKLKEDFKRLYFKYLDLYLRQKQQSEEVFSALSEKGINFLPLKGYYLNAVYPKEEYRVSSDIDVYIENKDRNAVKEVMLSCGFTLEKREADVDLFRDDGNVFIEFHHTLYQYEFKRRGCFKNVFARAERVEGCRFALKKEDMYIFHILHLAKHFLSGGAGVRFFTDLLGMRLKYTALNEDYIQKELTAFGLIKFRERVEKVVDFWFFAADADEKIKELSDFILKSNTFGEKELSVALSNRRVGRKGSAKYLFTNAFLPLTPMQGLFPVLKKAPFLLPVFWVVRWVKIIFSPEKRAKLKKAEKPLKAEVSAAERFLDASGLTDIKLG